MVPLNLNALPESNLHDEKDEVETAENEAKKTASPEVSFIEKMGKQ